MGQSVNSVHCGERTFRSFTQTFILCLGDIYRERGDWPVVIHHQMCVQRHGVSDADMEQSRESENLFIRLRLTLLVTAHTHTHYTL